MGKVNYRIVTLVAALASSILSAIALAFLVTSVIKYRAEDFFTASTTTDFVALGTCTETLTMDQIKQLDYSNPEIDCKDDPEQGNKKKLINTLRATVHSVYWTYMNGQIDDRSGTGALMNARDYHSSLAWGEHLREVMTAQWGHVLGKVDAFYAPGAGNKQEQFVNIGLNFTHVYEALRIVAEVDVPASCEQIYGLTYYDDGTGNVGISNDNLADVATASVESTVAAGKAAGTLMVDGIHVDTEYELFIKNIRKGRLDEDEKTKDTWPLQEFVINCPNEASTEGVEHLPTGLPANAAGVQADLTVDMKKYMYAHCVAQFQYASVGTTAWDGTYGIPLPGIEVGPFFYPYLNTKVDGFNSTSSYTLRARMHLGERFGFSIWAYVPMFLATCYLLGDALVFFYAESLMPITLADQIHFASSGLNNIRDSLVIASTTRSGRRKRLAIGFLAVLLSIIFYVYFIAAPWGFFYTSLPRPICEKTTDDPTTATGADPDHGVPQMLWLGTKGGWRADWDATWYDLMALFLQIFVLCLLPLTTTQMCRSFNNAATSASDGRVTETRVQKAAELVQNDTAYKFHMRVLVLPLVIGMVIIIVGQSWSGARFGMAWADGVVAQEWNVDKTGWLFDEVAISEHVYDQTIATLAATTACGLIFAVSLQRHMINGVGCFSAGLFFGWIVLVILFGLPLIFYAMSRSIFNEHKANEDCAVFPRTSHEFENDLCISRFWTFLVGGIIFGGTVLVITVLGLLEAFPALFANRKSASVALKPQEEESALMRKTGPASRTSAAFVSATQPFFNPTLKPKTRAMSSNDFLYGGKLNVPAPRR